ncbi:hypothetical protein DF121_24105 [Burkholderia stagnalis]|nr:hypothetical protein DF145_24850 [Burkholderia stagnalis]RQX94823.1 hypothetical protein DF121_24105 [Burkholderia stagnalis]RQY11288.1 hypothetical protein DF115_25735 [Burkholderia stagnalis]RQY27406.1 hypothetical protein DF114_25270 [Burkholderia stagnalis]
MPSLGRPPENRIPSPAGLAFNEGGRTEGCSIVEQNNNSPVVWIALATRSFSPLSLRQETALAD